MAGIQLSTRIVFGVDAITRLGDLAQQLGFVRTLIVSDPGIVAAGYAGRTAAILDACGIQSWRFDGFDANPDSAMVDAGRDVAAQAGVDSIVAVGGGSSLDCAKGINFVLTNGGTMAAYRGYGKAAAPMLPMIAVPTTAGTGSDAQSYALISDPSTHAKMACGDPKAAFRVAILDPALTVSQPREVTAIAGYDALSHAVESFVTTRHNEVSDVFAREAWKLLSGNYRTVLSTGDDVPARGAMLVGAHFAGAAIEQSMLGATHACANPLTARYGTIHGKAIAVMLPHVVRWNGEAVNERYAELVAIAQLPGRGSAASILADSLEEWARTAGMARTLHDLAVPEEDLHLLAADAATQWTGTFNPRPFDEAAAHALYRAAW